MLWLIHKPFFW